MSQPEEDISGEFEKLTLFNISEHGNVISQCGNIKSIADECKSSCCCFICANVSLAVVARCGESQNSWCEGLDTDSGYQASGINTEEIFSGTRMIFDMNSEHTMQEEFNLFL